MSEAGHGIGRLGEPLVRRRVHPGALTQDADGAREAAFRVLWARIERGARRYL